MPFVLRKIHKPRWYKNDIHPWLQAGELQASALVDLKTEANALSVWHIPDDRSNLDRVVTALAANGDNIAKLDFALLDIAVLSRLGFTTRSSPGGTCDVSANNQWHLDVVELSANRLLKLADALSEFAERGRVLEPRIVELIAMSLKAGHIEQACLKFKEPDRIRIAQCRAETESR